MSFVDAIKENKMYNSELTGLAKNRFTDAEIQLAIANHPTGWQRVILPATLTSPRKLPKFCGTIAATSSSPSYCEPEQSNSMNRPIGTFTTNTSRTIVGRIGA